MNAGAWEYPADAAPETSVSALWTAPLPGDGGLLTVTPAGGCVVSTDMTLSCFSGDGQLVWEVPAPGRVYGGEPVLAPDGSIIRIEEGLVITRALGTGEVLNSFPAPLSSGLCLAPWGDLLFSQAAPEGVEGVAALRCVTRTGAARWAVPLDDSAALVYEPFTLGDVVVAARNGALQAFSANGSNPWAADNHGVRTGRGRWTGGQASSAGSPVGAVELYDAPARLDGTRVVVALEWDDGMGLYLLDGATPAILPVAVPLPGRPPFVVVPHPPGEYRIAHLGPQVETSPRQWYFPVVATEPGGWESWVHRLPAKVIALDPGPGGNLIATSSPTSKEWQDYQQWYDLSPVTFVRCIDPDGAQRWTWHAPGPLTHLPAVSRGGVVFVGCAQKLWALPVLP